ncbi:MAG: glycosyltransferase [bacterium]|nr:glycosyltransferase [bacterium]
MSNLPLSIVIPVWNQLDYTRACVESLRRATDVAYELIIVDNGSATDSAKAAAELADVFIGNETNLGFAAGMNQGLKVATGEYVAFVNNDTVFPDAWASLLLETITTQHEPGIVLPAVTAAGNQASVRHTPSDRVTTFEPFAAIPSGVVYMVHRDTMVELGGWSDQYGIASAEDLDLLFSFWVNNRTVVLDERVLVKHESAVTAATLDNRRELYRRNRLAFATRWAKADPGAVPRLASCSDELFATNLTKARIAGTWMHKWFSAMDLADERAQSARKAEARLAPPAPAQAAQPSLLHRIARKLRR